MAQYLILVLRPNGYDHAKSLGEAARRDIDALNEEMEVAGIRIFVGGLRPTSSARSIHPQPDGSVSIGEGSGSSPTNYVDGLWILDCKDIDEAVDWGRKASAACRASIEVRPFY